VQLRIAQSGCIFNTQDIDVHSAAKDCICQFCLPALLCIPAPWFSFGEAPFSGNLLLGVVPHPQVYPIIYRVSFGGEGLRNHPQELFGWNKCQEHGDRSATGSLEST